MIEAGIADFTSVSFTGVVAPAGSAAIRSRVIRPLKSPDCMGE